MSPAQRYAPSFLILVKGTELRHGTTIDVLSVSVTETFNQADSFSFTVRDRHPQPGRLFAGGDQLQWMDSDVFNEGNEVEIHMGYLDNLELMLRGEITAASSSFPSSGQPTLSIQGYSLYHRLGRHRRRKPFKAATDSDIAREVVSDLNELEPNLKLEAEVDDTQIEYPTVSPKDATYAAFLNQRAKRINYEVTVKDRRLYFRRPGYVDNPSPALTLEWGRNLISFNPRLSTHGAVSEVTVRGSQSSQGRGKDAVVGTSKAGDQRVTMGSKTGQQITQSVFGKNQVVVEDHSVGSQEEANQVARACLEAGSLDYIQGKGSCVGDPQLKAGTLIELKGLGQRFSGVYYVTSTTHKVDGSGYRTDFDVKRNAR